MRVLVVSQFKQVVHSIIKRIPEFQLVANNPNVVICYGGDGTILMAERLHPGIPKYPIRGYGASQHDKQKIIQSLRSLLLGLYDSKKIPKINILVHGKKYLALNEVVVRTLIPTQALRCDVRIDRKLTQRTPLMADGVIIATAFGSFGYYQSINRQSFTRGIYLSAINPVEPFKAIKLHKNQIVEIKVLRKKAMAHWDNCPKMPKLKIGDIVKVFQSSQCAQIWLCDGYNTDWKWSPVIGAQ